jgi:hypothetical protein
MLSGYIFVGMVNLFILSLIEFAIVFETCGHVDLSVFNPVENYRRWTSMNWFGVILFTFLLNIICPGLAVCYWFWKLCTVGRKR